MVDDDSSETSGSCRVVVFCTDCVADDGVNDQGGRMLTNDCLVEIVVVGAVRFINEGGVGLTTGEDSSLTTIEPSSDVVDTSLLLSSSNTFTIFTSSSIIMSNIVLFLCAI